MSASRRLIVAILVTVVMLSAAPSDGLAIQATPVATSSYVAQHDLATLKGTITADGSSTVWPVTDEAGILFHDLADDVRVQVAFSGTGGGFRKFCAGETDIQSASRPVEADERAACAAAGIGHYAFRVAFDGITVVVNKDNDFVTCLTVEQLRSLWQPDAPAETWRGLDPTWPDEEIELYGPGPLSGTFDYFTAAVLGEEGRSRTDYFPSENDLDLVEGVEDREDGLGYFGYAYYLDEGDKLNAVAVDAGQGCVAPSAATIADGSYAPLSRPLYVYVKAESLQRAEVQEFLRFYLASAGGIASDVGYVPSRTPTTRSSSPSSSRRSAAPCRPTPPPPKDGDTSWMTIGRWRPRPSARSGWSSPGPARSSSTARPAPSATSASPSPSASSS